MWLQKEIKLSAKPRGFHLVTGEIVKKTPEITQFSVGIVNLFIKHTSASLSINENADATVREDFEQYFNRSVPENQAYYQHTYEGSDDLPAHLKCSILGCSLEIPLKNGYFNLGTWQGVYLCEHRNHGGARNLVVTIQGEKLKE